MHSCLRDGVPRLTLQPRHQMMQPEKLLYMAIDGVAPRAKARHSMPRACARVALLSS